MHTHCFTVFIMKGIGDNSTITLMHPTSYMDNYLPIFYVIFAAFGIPINLTVAGVIIFLKRLHSPRNIIWLGVGFSNILILLGFILEFISSRMETASISSWKMYFNLTAGLPTASLFVNLHLSLLNRYVSFHHPIWYKRSITNSRIIIGQIISFGLIFLILKGRYLFDPMFEPDLFSLDNIVPLIIMNTLGMLFTYLIYRLVFAKANMTERDHNIEQSHFAVRYQKSAEDPNGIKHGEEESVHFIRIGGKRISRLEMEASTSMFFSIKSFFAFGFPALFSFLMLFTFCIRVPDGEPSTFCSVFSRVSFYIRGILLGFYSSFFNPVSFVIHSSDFIDVLSQKISSPWNLAY